MTNNTVSDNQLTGIRLDGAPAALRDNVISGTSNGYAVQVPVTLGQGVVYNNSYSGNQYNAMYLTGGSVTATTTWPASNSPYVFAPGVINVNNNSVLTIDPGVVVKFNMSSISVNAGSTLNATGAVFTSYKDDAHGGDTNGDGAATSPAPGDWFSIKFNGGGGALNGIAAFYGGHYSDINYLGEIDINGSSPTITGSSISYSQEHGIYIRSGSSPSIHYNDIYGNANGFFGLYTSGSTMDATNNWWGGIGGPKPYGSGNGVNNANASPWSDVPFTQAGAEAQAMGTDTWCGAFGEPVNTSTGAFVYAHKDIDIPTRGLPLEFERTYNSNAAGDGPLGYGWSFNWQVSANPRPNGDVVILRGDGRRDTFIKNPDESYSAPAGRHDTLVKNPDGTFKLSTKEQVVYNFNAVNRLASVVSETGQITTLTYDANKRLTTVTEPTGRTLAIAYNAANRIDHLTDPQNNTVGFGYSAAGDLTSVTDQNGGVTDFTYDSYHHIIAITDPNSHTFVNNVYDTQGRVAEQTDAEQHLLTFAYDAANRRTTMTRQMDPQDPARDEVTVHEFDANLRLTKEIDALVKETTYTYDTMGNRDSTTDRRGVITRQIFDSSGNVTDLYNAYGRPEQQHTHITYNAKNHPLAKTDARGFTTSYTYDQSGTYLQQITYPQVTNYDSSTASYTQAFTYNANGTLASATDRNGDVTGFSYDGDGNPDVISKNTNRPQADQVNLDYDFDSLGRRTAFTDGNGHQTTYEHNNIGDLRYVRTQVTNPETQVLEDVITEYRYDGNGNRTVVIDPEGKTTSFAYTAMDKLSQVTDPKLNTTQQTYDAAYNLSATKDRNGNWSHFAYDKNHRLVSVKDSDDNETTYAYDEEGNQTSVTDPLGRTVSRTYDALGRITAISEPDEGQTQRTTSYNYDQADHLLATTDPLNHTYSRVYDELGRLRQDSDPLNNSVYHRYDGQGNRVKSKDQRGYETSFTYSPNDRLTGVTDPLQSVTAYAYDKNGNMTSQTDAESHTILYAYDQLSRLLEEKVDAGGGNYLLEKDYVYDKAGNLVKDITGDGSIAYGYDDAYNLTGVTDRQNATYSFTYDANGNRLTATDNANQKTVSFAYNSRGLLAQATDVHGATESFAYDAVGNLAQRDDTVAGQSFTTSYDYTPRNQQKTVTRGTDATSYTFDAAGRLTGKSYANGVNASFSYDSANRPTSQQAVKDAQTLQSFSQAYDAAGNVTSLTENGTLVTNYGYDEINRLTSENIGGLGAIAYGHDRVGNRTSESHPVSGTTNYSDNQANQLTQTVNGSATTDYAYNAGGALAQKTTGAGNTSYDYNGLDKLTQVTTPTATVNYAYDALGRRISRSEGSDIQNFHLNGNSDLEDYQTDGSGNLTSALLRGADGLISETDYTGQSPVTKYNLYNPHGDTAAQTDADGQLTGTYRYDSFGNPTSGNPPRNGYTGKWQRDRENATGTIRMGVREYDPALGQFTSPDVLRGDPAQPLQRNRYGYVGGNPLTRYDLNGREWYKPWTWFEDEEGKQIEAIDANNAIGANTSIATDAGSLIGPLGGAAAGVGIATGSVAAAGAATGIIVTHALITEGLPPHHYSPQDCTAGYPRDGVHYRPDIFFSSPTAGEIIGQTKKGAINREFPSNMRDKTLEEIDRLAREGDMDARKAKKLLNDKSFDKKDNRK